MDDIIEETNILLILYFWQVFPISIIFVGYSSNSDSFVHQRISMIPTWTLIPTWHYDLHCIKSVRIRSYSGPHFLEFLYTVFWRFQGIEKGCIMGTNGLILELISVIFIPPGMLSANKMITGRNVSKYGVFSGPCFVVFSPNTRKYGPEKNSVFGHFSRSGYILYWT